MPKTVDNYIIRKQLFKDSFQIQYSSCEHKILKKSFRMKKIEKAIQNCSTKQQENRNRKLSFTYSCIQNQSNQISINQVQISRQLKSQKVIKCLKILKAKNAVYAIYDQHPERSLQKILSSEYLTSQKKQNILNQVILLVRELHDHNIALGNLSNNNLYLTQDYKLMISNFLLARPVDDAQEVHIDPFFLDNSCVFYAPQLIQNGTLTKSADIYSLGQIIKSLKLDKSDHNLLSPLKFAFQNIKDLAYKMINENPQNRPSIAQFQKQFRLNKSRNKSTCGSNGSRDHEKKLADVKGLESYKSEATLKFQNQKTESKTLNRNESKKSFLTNRQSLMEDILIKTSPKRIALKSRATMDFDYPLKISRTLNFEATVVKRSKDMESERSSKLGASMNKIQSSFAGESRKKIMKEVSLLRNMVSFLIEMVLFVNGQKISKKLSCFLVQQALNHTDYLLKIFEFLMKEEEVAGKKFIQFVQQCQKQKKKLEQIAFFFRNETQSKGLHEFEITEELKKFGRNVLNSYASNFSIQKHQPQVSETTYKSKYANAIENQKTKENEEKLFKTFILLKRLEYGAYLDFFRAKVHHSNKKFWNEHYFEFEKTFGGKYFAFQIKDLIVRK